MELTSSHLGCSEVDVAVNKLWLQADSVFVVVQGLLELTPLLVDISEIGVGLGKDWVLLDGQGTELGRSGERASRTQYSVQNATPLPLLHHHPVATTSITTTTTHYHHQRSSSSEKSGQNFNG